MTLFGKEIQIEEDQIKYIIGGALLVVTVLMIVLLVVPKISELRAAIVKLEQTKTAFQNKTSEKQLAEQQLVDRKKQYEQQQVNLSALIQKFQEASLRDDTDLKIVIQKLINRLGIKSTEIARSEITDQTRTKPDGSTEMLYSKVYVPYKLRGDFTRVGRLLYYLENSKWLLTFNGSDLKITRVEEKDRQMIDVSFKVGGYTNINAEALGISTTGAAVSETLPAVQ